jgi:Ca2+/H+ antiporter
MKHSPDVQHSSKLTRYLPLRTGNLALDFGLILVPAAFVVGYVSHSAVMIFVASALGIIPLAASLGKATEDISSKLGEKLGGLLNATMGATRPN